MCFFAHYSRGCIDTFGRYTTQIRELQVPDRLHKKTRAQGAATIRQHTALFPSCLKGSRK